MKKISFLAFLYVLASTTHHAVASTPSRAPEFSITSCINAAGSSTLSWSPAIRSALRQAKEIRINSACKQHYQPVDIKKTYEQDAQARTMYKEKLGTFDLNPSYEAAVNKAFAVCGIDPENIIVMQQKTGLSFAGSVTPSNHKPLMQICGPQEQEFNKNCYKYGLFSLYHECGHIIHGDGNSRASMIKDILIGLVGLGIGLATTSMLPDSKNTLSNTIKSVGGGSLGAWLAIRALAQEKERYADAYATEKLIQLKEYDALAVQLIHRLRNPNMKKNKIVNFIQDAHQTEHYRAEALLQQLLKHRVDIFNPTWTQWQASSALTNGKDTGILDRVQEEFPDLYKQFEELNRDNRKQQIQSAASHFKRSFISNKTNNLLQFCTNTAIPFNTTTRTQKQQ